MFCYTKVAIDAPTLSHKIHAPRWFQIGLTDGNFQSTPEDNYRQIYYEALDLVIESINSRFNQPGYKVYRNVEDLVLNACRGCPYDTELSNVCDFYKDEISKMQLQAQLPLLQALFAEEKNQSELSINDIVTVTAIFCSTTCIQQCLGSNEDIISNASY